MRDRININKSMCPYSFNIVLNEKLYNIRVDYNATGDFFTLTFSRENEISHEIETFCTEPLVYGVYLFQDIYQPQKYPAINLIPWDESENKNCVNFETLNETVFLTIDNQG